MNRSFSLAAICAAAILFAGPQVRAADDEIIQAQAGSWLLAPQDGSKGCRLTFDTADAAGGHALTGAEACATTLPAIAGARAWNIGDDGSLTILDAASKVLIRFQEEEGSPWESEDGNPMWLLPALGDIDHVPTASSLAGTWKVLQQPDGKSFCNITLSRDLDADGTPKMSVDKDCPADISDLKLTAWTLEGFGLVLMGDDGSAVSFDMRPDGNFQKSEEEEGDPLTLIRQ